jgi:DNA-binding CsgD family transcriptional regulator
VESYILDRKCARDELWDSEERFRAFVTASSDVVYSMSPAWDEMRHLRGRQFIPDTDSPSTTWVGKYIHPDDQPHVLAAINEAIRTKSLFELEHRVLRVDGTLGWTFSRAIPLLDSNGEIIEWVGAAKDITERKRMEEELRLSRDELQLRVRELAENEKNLQEANIALKVMLKHKEEYQKEFGETVLANVRNLVLPYLEKLKNTQMSSTQSTMVEILGSHLEEITSSFTRTLGMEAADLTPTEMRVAAFIRDGKSSAEIAEILCSSEKTIENHRGNIRKKLGLKSRSANLRSYLLKLA